MSKVYDFLSEETEAKWKGVLDNALRKIQKQVHPRLDIEEGAVEYLEMLIYQLLAQMCAAEPKTMQDVEANVMQSFAHPINLWCLRDAQDKMERYAIRKRGVFIFPMEKLFHQLQKEVFKYKIELPVIQFVMCVLDYVAADILKLAGNFVKNTRKPAMTVILDDIKVSMSADPALQALFKPLQSAGECLLPVTMISDLEFNADSGGTIKYDELYRDLLDNERQFIRQVNLILKVFQPPLMENPDLFPSMEVETIFDHLPDILELSTQLQVGIEEMIEMSSEMEGPRTPPIGFCFEESAESEEFSVYLYYTENYMEALMALESIIQDEEVTRYLKQKSDEGHLPKLFKEAVQYVLPRALHEPIYHFFYYCNMLSAMIKATDDDEDYIALDSALSPMMSQKLLIERESSRFLPRRREEVGMYGHRLGYRHSMKKLIQLQEKIEGWDGPDIYTQCTELVREGTLTIGRNTGKRTQKQQRLERHVFLLDGLVICCKQQARRGGETNYKLKEKINMKGKVELIDLDDVDDTKFAFEIREQDQPGIIFFTVSPPEKNEWMAAFTNLLTRSTFEKMLDAKLREEEKEIPVLSPDPKHYIFAEENSADNVMYDEESSRDSHKPQIKAATIHKLVERLTYHEYADPNFVRTFLMTYRSFCKPPELMALLIERYSIPIPVELDDMDRRDPKMREALKRFRANYISPIQLRVLNVMRHWVDSHYYDFDNNTSLLHQLKSFVGSVKARNMQKWVTSIHRALQRREGSSQASHDIIFSQDPPPIEWHLTTDKEKFNLLTLHPVEFARQVTYVMSEMFKAIRPSEMVDASWTKEGKKEYASANLLKMSRFENKLAIWLKTTIVQTENFEERVAIVSRIIDIMVELKEMNNFAGIFACNAALQSSQVFRLKLTFREVYNRFPRRKPVLEEIQQLASSDRGYKNYRKRLRSINPPCVPFVGMYLSWIVFIRDGNEGRIKGQPDNFINFKKMRMIADVLQEIQQYQNTPYCLKPEQSIQDYIIGQTDDFNSQCAAQGAADKWEDVLYELSLEIEPRDGTLKKAPRSYKGDLRPPSASQSGGVMNQLLTLHRPNKKISPVPAFPPDAAQEQGDSKESAPESPLPPSPNMSQESAEMPAPPLPPRPPTPPPLVPPRDNLHNQPYFDTMLSSYRKSKPPAPPPPETQDDGPYIIPYVPPKPPAKVPKPPAIPPVSAESPPPPVPSSPTNEDSTKLNGTPPPIPPSISTHRPPPALPPSALPPSVTSSLPPPLPPPPQNLQNSPGPPPRPTKQHSFSVGDKLPAGVKPPPPPVPPKPSRSAGSTPTSTPTTTTQRQRLQSEPVPPIPPRPSR